MSERKKYAELYGRQDIATDQRAAFGAIWRSVWGDDLAYELAPTNFVTWDDLHRVAAELRVGAGARVLDLGCGRGGPGLWVARQTKASLIGIDFSPEGCAAARAQAAAKFSDVVADYRIADMTATGLADASVDAAMSIDALQLVPSRASAFREAARLLRAGARFVFTTWDHPGVGPEVLLAGRELVSDSRPLLEEAGFRIETYDRITSWDERAVATYRGLLAQREVVEAVAGEGVLREAEWGAVHARSSVHVFVVCERR